MNCLQKMTEEENIRLDTRSLESGSKKGLVENIKTLREDFGFYEFNLLLFTQVAYIPIAAAMLMTTFMEPSPEWCDYTQQSNSAWIVNSEKEFYSVSVEHGYACQSDSSRIVYWISTCLMLGALVGSFVCGYLSDRFGRKPTCAGSLFMVSICHSALAFSGFLNWYFMSMIICSMGFFCGGYMVTNFVLLTEAFELARSRLLVVSLNGWSLSMAVTGLLARATLTYSGYHSIFALIGVSLTCLLLYCSHESCRWLSAKGELEEAKRIAIDITKFNGRRRFGEDELELLEWNDILGFSAPIHSVEKKTWRTLFSQFSKPTLVMCYSFLASSIVSFGFYFSIDILPGNRYVNIVFMGVAKFVLGFFPFLLNHKFSKRCIAISSIAICCIAAVMIVIIQYFDVSSWRAMISLLSVVISAGIDPTWKINHLYSAELFPTSVRSMARGVCNAGGRLGSVMAPLIVYFRTINLLIPNAVFTILLLVQLVVIVIFLPNDTDKDANEMNDE